MKKLKAPAILFLLICFTNFLGAQWRCALKNVLEPTHNVELLLEFNGDISQSREVQAEIRIRKRGILRDYLRKTVSLSIGEEKWFHIPLMLASDVYQYEVEVSDPFSNSSQIVVEEEIFVVSAGDEVKVSDIYLSGSNDAQVAFAKPFLATNLPGHTDTLYYFMELSSTKEITVKSSAFFYENARQQESAKGDILLYASLQEKVQNQEVGPTGKALISGAFPVENLKKGEYLLEITVITGIGEPIQETGDFIIGSNLEQRIFSDLDNAIRQMAYILPAGSINEMLDSPTKESRRIEFDEAWEDLFREDAEEEMEKYYSRIYEVEDLFIEEAPGWQTDRGKIYIQYGKPGKIETFDRNGKTLTRWLYPQWSLMFLFEERNQNYFLVE